MAILIQAIILVIFMQKKVSGFINVDLIDGFNKENSLQLNNVIGCFTKLDQINLAKKVMLKENRLIISNIRSNIEVVNSHFLATKQGHVGVILDGDCPNAANFLKRCGTKQFFDYKHHWLILTSTFAIFIKIIKDVPNLNINANIQVATPNEMISKHNNRNIWTIFDVYNPASEHNGHLNYTIIGFYDDKLGYSGRVKELKYWARKNMTGVIFRTMFVSPNIFNNTESLREHLASNEHPEINSFNRFHCRLMHYCKNFYNYSLNVSVEKSWGYTNPDGTFNGMVGALEKKTIDFGCAALFLREDRAKVIDYGRNTWIFTAGFIFRNPKSRSSFDIFIKPLSTSVWLLTLLFGFLCSLILKMAITFEHRKFHCNYETSWSGSLIFTIGAFCQQGAPNIPNLYCGRIITISIFLLSLLIYQFYSASVVSQLLLIPPTHIKTILDLLKSPLKVASDDTLYNRDYFLHTTDKAAKQLYYTKIFGKKNTSNFLPPEKGLKLVQKGNYAYHVETTTAYPIILKTFSEKAICELRVVKMFRTQPMSSNYQKNSPFRDMINFCLHRTQEYGILSRERKFWQPRRPECIYQQSRAILRSVGLDEFYPALLILVLGIIISLTLLFVEFEYHKIFGRTAPNKKNTLFPFIE